MNQCLIICSGTKSSRLKLFCTLAKSQREMKILVPEALTPENPDSLILSAWLAGSPKDYLLLDSWLPYPSCLAIHTTTPCYDCVMLIAHLEYHYLCPYSLYSLLCLPSCIFSTTCSCIPLPMAVLT